MRVSEINLRLYFSLLVKSYANRLFSPDFKTHYMLVFNDRFTLSMKNYDDKCIHKTMHNYVNDGKLIRRHECNPNSLIGSVKIVYPRDYMAYIYISPYLSVRSCLVVA